MVFCSLLFMENWAHCETLPVPAGALAGLQRRWPPGSGRTGAQWVDAGRSFGAFVYSTYTEASYDAIWANYSYISPGTWWFRQDFGKANSSSAHPRRADALPQARQVWLQQVGASGCHSPLAMAAVHLALWKSLHGLCRCARGTTLQWLTPQCPSWRAVRNLLLTSLVLPSSLRRAASASWCARACPWSWRPAPAGPRRSGWSLRRCRGTSACCTTCCGSTRLRRACLRRAHAGTAHAPASVLNVRPELWRGAGRRCGWSSSPRQQPPTPAAGSCTSWGSPSRRWTSLSTAARPCTQWMTRAWESRARGRTPGSSCRLGAHQWGCT